MEASTIQLTNKYNTSLFQQGGIVHLHACTDMLHVDQKARFCQEVVTTSNQLIYSHQSLSPAQLDKVLLRTNLSVCDECMGVAADAVSQSGGGTC